eukprot:CAMPEP_0172677970 /NCGR_PEP_ID=MMETSP1074-20121228/15047_1 /TAXON_ID=2916 /ORGANISM="Ceratium fusus, Strain PA161109" /LENGTH=260 /DNA_ID=CAMNT_0013495905 /DNA_START=108 /DNA_END=890 /DNA_ORIENTATION=-
MLLDTTCNHAVDRLRTHDGKTSPPPEPFAVPVPTRFIDATDDDRQQKELETELLFKVQAWRSEEEKDAELEESRVRKNHVPVVDSMVGHQCVSVRGGMFTEDLPRRKRHLEPFPDWVRTVVIRNIPYSCTMDDLENDWPPDGSYDYIHMPCDSRKLPLGYVYINFVSPRYAAAFQARWHGRFLAAHFYCKSLSVAVATRQGLCANLASVKSNYGGAELPWLFRGRTRLTVAEVLEELDASRRQLGKAPFSFEPVDAVQTR